MGGGNRLLTTSTVLVDRTHQRHRKQVDSSHKNIDIKQAMASIDIKQAMDSTTWRGPSCSTWT
jgi:hypothetical protein